MMIRARRCLCVAAVATLPFVAGAGVAGASGVSTDRTRVDTNTDLNDGDDFLVDVRIASVDDDGDATGVRSQTTSSDIYDVQDVRSDTRGASNDEGNDSTSGRLILGADDASLDGVDSDIDLVMIDGNDDRNDGATSGGQVAGQRDGATDEQRYADDSEFVFGG